MKVDISTDKDFQKQQQQLLRSTWWHFSVSVIAGAIFTFLIAMEIVNGRAFTFHYSEDSRQVTMNDIISEVDRRRKQSKNLQYQIKIYDLSK